MNKAKYLNDVLTLMEAEEIISKQFKQINLDNYGNEEFMKQHVLLERVNMQAIKNALLGSDDFILEHFVTYEKIKMLIHELFVAYNFKQLIYPKIKSQICEKATCKVYILLYHEAVIINLLENFFYHVTACLAVEDYIIDVIEYCYSKISKVVNNQTKMKPILHSNLAELENKTSVDEMQIKYEEIEFYTAMASISIIRYITDHLLQLPFPIRNHIMNVKDIPLLLVALMETHPWIREIKTNGENTSEAYVFENNHWNKLINSNKLPKLEAQVWIAIFNLFMNSDNNKKYEITEFRKNNLLRIRKYMNDSLFDQIPPLQQLYRALEEMSLMQFNPVQSSNPFVVEVIPVLFNAKFSDEEINRICLKISNEYFSNNEEQLKKEMELVSEVYSLSNMEYFMEDPKCANCLKDASSRCSKCKSEWYCSKDCQIKRWKLHKEICGKLAELNNEMNPIIIKDKNVENFTNEDIKISSKAESGSLNKFDELD